MWIVGLVWASAKLAERLRYRNDGAVERAIRAKKNLAHLVGDHDWVFELAAIVAIWCETIALLALAARFASLPVTAAIAIVVAGRLRALQEVGHTAIHLGFGRTKRVQWFLADVFGNYLLFKPSSERRHKSHCIAHHPNAAREEDPNVVRLRRIGFVPGIGRLRFAKLLFHPLTRFGFAETLVLMRESLGSRAQTVARSAIAGAIFVALTMCLGTHAVIAWAAALLFVYPLFSWWSLLAEHQWFVPPLPRRDHVAHDCHVTHRTVYAPLAGIVIRALLCPLTDGYHLAHHIFPRLHWRYMPAADRALAAIDPRYAAATCRGLVFADSKAPSALSSLYARMVTR